MITDEAKRVRAQAYAEYVRKTVERKHNIERSIAKQREELELSGVALGEKITICPSADAIPDGVGELVDMIGRYSADLNEYVNTVDRFLRDIQRLWPQYERVLEMHYIEGKRLDEIAELTYYTERHVYNLRRSGLIGLYDVMPARWRECIIS